MAADRAKLDAINAILLNGGTKWKKQIMAIRELIGSPASADDGGE